MNTKRDFIRARFLVFGDIIFTGLTILTGWVWDCTPADALSSTYLDQVSDTLSYVFFIMFILSLMLVIVAWTIVLSGSKKRIAAIIFYALSIIFGYCSTFPLIWAVNGFEHMFGTLKLLVSGALIWHLYITDIEGKEEEKSESKPKKDDIPDRKVKEDENEMRKQRILSKFHRKKKLEEK
jgi:hypothetical protein